MAVAQIAEYIRPWLEGLNRGDVSAAAETFAPDCVIHITGSPEPLRGPAAFAEFVGALIAAFPDVHFEVEDQVEHEDKVVIRWRAEGTHAPARQCAADRQAIACRRHRVRPRGSRQGGRALGAMGSNGDASAARIDVAKDRALPGGGEQRRARTAIGHPPSVGTRLSVPRAPRAGPRGYRKLQSRKPEDASTFMR